nr:hypothetical protein Iba_chr03aCG8100 [Ipomoea batatas]
MHKPSAMLKFYPPVNGIARLELNEILTIKEQKRLFLK